MNKRLEPNWLSEAIDKGIRSRTTDLLKMDLSNMTADAKEQFIRSVKDSILDSESFRNEVAESIAELVLKKQRRKLWQAIKFCGAVFGWAIGIFVAIAAFADSVKSILLYLLGLG